MKTCLLFIICCIAVLNAKSANFGDYRTRRSGYWHTNICWERYNGSSWVAATESPNYANAGVITIRSQHTITNDAELDVDQLLVYGTLMQEDVMNVRNQGFLYDLSINDNGRVEFSGSLTRVTAGAEVSFNQGSTALVFTSLINDGTIYYENGYFAFAGGALINNGQFIIGNDNAIVDIGVRPQLSSFTNNYGAVFTKTRTQDSTFCLINFINYGTMNIETGAFVPNYRFENSGTVNILNEATFSNQGDAFLNTGTSISGDGSMAIGGNVQWNGGRLAMNTPVENTATVNLNGDEVILNSALTNSGIINWNNGYLSFDGGTIINNNAFNVNGGSQLFSYTTGSFTNSNGGTFTKLNSGSTISGIDFTNNGTMNFQAGYFFTNKDFINTGNLVFSTAALINNGDVSFYQGTGISGNGSITQQGDSLKMYDNLVLPAGIDFTFYSGVIKCERNLSIRGSLGWFGGELKGAGNLTIAGSTRWDGGRLAMNATIQNTAIADLSGGDVIIASSLTNNGTINWNAGYLSFDGGTLINNSNFNVVGNNELYPYTTGIFYNYGIFTKRTGTGNTTNRINFFNYGTVNLQSGTFLNTKEFTNESTLNFTGGATFTNDFYAHLNAGTSLTGNGNIIEEFNTLYINSALNLPGTITLAFNSGYISGTGSLTLNGNMNWSGNGTLGVNCTVQNSGVINLTGYEVTLFNKTLTNNGIINWNSDYFSFRDGGLINNKTLNITSANNNEFYSYSGGSITNSTTGIISKTSAGTTKVSLPFANNGVIKGAGSFDFGINLTNKGTFAPGISKPAILTTGSNYVNNILEIEMLDGRAAGKGYDKLVVNGDVQLTKSTLNILRKGAVPNGSYTILSCTGKINGNFKTITAPAGFTVTKAGRTIVVNVVNAPLIAFNEKQTDHKLIIPNFIHRYQPWKIIGLNGLNATISIFDVQGNTVWKLNNYQNSADLSRLAPALYFYQVLYKDADQMLKIYTGKLVVAD